MSPPDSETLTLSVPQTVFCPGCDVQGEVLLLLPQARQKNVHLLRLKLYGSAQTSSWESWKNPVIQTVVFVDTALDLWSQGAADSSPGTDILHLPFSLRLPDDIPPSFRDGAAYIEYELTVIGVRSGTFEPNLIRRKVLEVMPKDERGVSIRETIKFLGWRKREQVAQFRKGLLSGNHATAHVELLLPDTPNDVFPLFTDIPFIINVTTTSAPMTRAKADKRPEDQFMSPSPPPTHTWIRFKLRRTRIARAGGVSYTSVGDVVYFMGEAGDTGPRRMPVATDLPPKEWVVVQPSGGDNQAKNQNQDQNQTRAGEEKGVWVQRGRYESKMNIHVPPTFRSKTIDCSYSLELVVALGPGKAVSISFPVTIVSGIDGPLLRSSRR